MRIVELIRRKRDGGELSAEEIGLLISAYTRGEIEDYHVAAWLMAVVWRGMTRAELAALTEAMLRSGEVLDLSELPGPKVDKHSTGGVGDKTSLLLAPMVAAAGVYVPMISGRGLGHSGGTLDKLESIPGFNVNLTLEEFRRVLKACGCALIGQTKEIAPADKKLYALRDVTATVESPYLICASIMSKKLAEGIDALVLDVKTGSGAFMKKTEDAAYLAELMVETGRRMGKRVVALITDMNQPLGACAGNALEVRECIEILQGKMARESRDLWEVTEQLAGYMLWFGGKSATVEEGRRLARRLVESGAAREKFREIIRLQGGDAGVIDDTGRLPRARHTLALEAPRSGYVARIQCERLGVACCVLGGGREKKEDTIDPAVGLVMHKKLGDSVARGEPYCTIHYNSEARLAEARAFIEQACEFTEGPPASLPPLVYQVLGL